MSWPTDRIVLYDRSLTCIGELTRSEVRKRERTEEINGTHELVIVTTRVLREGTRLLTVDGTGKWREHVVYKTPESHKDGRQAVGTYTCKWSLQYDLESTYAKDHAEPGMGSSCTSTNAVRAAIDGQAIWGVGECDVPAVAAGKGRVMIGKSGWDRLKLVVEAWGGEVDAEITVDATGVVSRNVVLRTHLGSTEVKRRFDWAKDLTEIKRDADPGPYFCRIIPLGRGQREYAEDDETEFEWPLDISEETPDGRVYIQDDEAAAVFRTADGHGGYHYPSKVVKYDEDDPELLLNAGTEDLHNHTRPNVAYGANVLQFVEAGMDAQGVELGDETQCADWGFNPDESLCVQGRITRMVVNELAPKTDTKLTLGNLSTSTSFSQTIMELIGSGTQSITSRINMIEGGGTIAYVENLLDAINAMIAADGGYTYLVSGEGSITYDTAVADPLVGTEATRVTQMKGGSLRFAKAKKPGFSGINDWNWTNVITPDGYLGLAATIAAITTGFIGNQNGTYIDLENNTAVFGPTSGYHFTVNTNGITFWNGDTQLGKYLASSTILGDMGNAHLEIDSNSMEVYGGKRSDTGNPVLVYSAGYDTGSSYINLIDYTSTCHVKLNASGFGSSIELKSKTGADSQANICAFFGWDHSHLRLRYDLGRRKENTDVGNYSLVGGTNNTASGTCSTAFGTNNVASGNRSIVGGQNNSCDSTDALVMGHDNTAGYSSQNVLIIGEHNDARQESAKSSNNCALIGEYLELYAGHRDCLIVGKRNWDSSSNTNDRFVVGNGAIVGGSSYTRNLLRVGGPDNADGSGGYMILSGTMTAREYVTSSDRRLKEHVNYLREDACDFVRKLKPALYEKDGSRHVGFYAQDVQEAEPEEWDTVTVSEWRTEESSDFDTMTLDYNALIAPLVAYAQSLERRIDEQQRKIDDIMKRLSELEARE